MILSGTYFPRHSSRPVPAAAYLSENGLLVVISEPGTILASAPSRQVKTSSRLANLRRRLDLPDGSHFETADNDGVDALLLGAGQRRSGAFVHRLESSLHWAAASLLIAIGSAVLMFLYGFPAVADWLAYRTPQPVLAVVSRETLSTLDRMALRPSRLSSADKHRADALFARIARAGAKGPRGYHLLFREGGSIGPNAFSLPDGTIIMTDELYEFSKSDDELEGVFGHEIAHTDRRHGLQKIYEASLLPAAIALITGDASQIGQIAAVLPTVLIEASYSRKVEQQADDDSAIMMKRIGGNPAALGNLLLRLDRHLCGRSSCSAGWLGSHPDGAERAARLRAEANSSIRH